MRLRPWYIVALFIVGYLATGVQFIGHDEQGVVRRFGRALPQLAEPGARVGLPWPMDRVDRIKPREVKRVSITWPAEMNSRPSQDSLPLTPDPSPARGEGSEVAHATKYLTGDRNLVTMQATIQYALADGADYLFEAHEVEAIVAATAETTIGQQLARAPIDQVLTLGKLELSASAAEVLQRRLDDYGLGVAVRSIDISAIEPPPEVADAFDRVTGALREREQVVNQARSFADRTITQAHSAAQQRLDEARTFDHRERLAAAAEAERFEKLLSEYEQAPLLTAHRLYLETMAAMLPRWRTKVVDGSKTPIDVGIFGSERP